MSRNEREEFLTVGNIVSTHGIRGEVKVYPTTDDPRRFDSLESVVLSHGKERLNLTVEGVKYFKQLVILKFKEFGNINEIEKYRGARLLIPREEAVELQEDEYFECDLIGMDVTGDDGEELGVLTEVLHTGANDVYEVETKEGKKIYLPAIHECIRNVDVENGVMNVHVMDGLL